MKSQGRRIRALPCGAHHIVRRGGLAATSETDIRSTEHTREQTDAMKHVTHGITLDGVARFVEIATDKGHDAFLLDDPRYHGVVWAYFERVAQEIGA